MLLSPANWSHAVSVLFGEALQGAYSDALYSAAGRVPLAALRVVWLDLLDDDALRLVGEIGVCPL
eukprot:2736629-Prymnesium_polylepis.1